MRLIVLMLLLATCGVASARTRDCRAIQDPTALLACYNDETPPATAKRPRATTTPSPKVDAGKTMGSLDPADATMRARINGICRGC